MTETSTQPGKGTWTLLVVLALLPSLASLTAGWIADDAAILGYVQREGALADWTASQYGLQLVSFWRPVVTTSWWMQEATSSFRPPPQGPRGGRWRFPLSKRESLSTKASG